MLNSFHPLPDDIADHWHRPLFQNELTGIARLAARVEADAMRIQRIPAPTFAEGQRADFVAQRFAALGLADVTRDEMDNVCGRIVGRERGPALMISAHLDTVFGRKVALTLHQESHRLVGPGIGDNSMGVAGLLGLADFLRHRKCFPKYRSTRVACATLSVVTSGGSKRLGAAPRIGSPSAVIRSPALPQVRWFRASRSAVSRCQWCRMARTGSR